MTAGAQSAVHLRVERCAGTLAASLDVCVAHRIAGASTEVRLICSAACPRVCVFVYATAVVTASRQGKRARDRFLHLWSEMAHERCIVRLRLVVPKRNTDDWQGQNVAHWAARDSLDRASENMT